MQPIYLAGHSRPVRKVLYNYDGDLLFTCSDDGTVCMYKTYDCQRIGIFTVKEAVKSFDVTKDSKYLIAVATTFGACIYNVSTGALINKVKVPGIRTI
jgi:WD40 repeat protein